MLQYAPTNRLVHQVLLGIQSDSSVEDLENLLRSGVVDPKSFWATHNLIADDTRQLQIYQKDTLVEVIIDSQSTKQENS